MGRLNAVLGGSGWQVPQILATERHAAEHAAMGAGLPGARHLRSSQGTTVIDFGDGSGIATAIANQSSCVYAFNPTGWHDGTGCLEVTPNTDGFSELRFYFDSTKQFSLFGDDGYAVEWELPSVADKGSAPSANFSIGKGATSTATPANNRAVGMLKTSATPQHVAGRRYDRHRWDFDNTDANCGVWPGHNPGVAGTGVSQADTINWCRFEMTNLGGKTIKIKRLVRGGRAQACLVLATDSAAFDALTEIESTFLASRGLRFSVNQYWGGGNGIDDIAASRRNINAIYRSGGEFNINDLIDRDLSTAGLTAAQAEVMARECIAKAQAQGWYRGSNVFVYNNNGYTDAVVAGLQAAGVVAGRGGIKDGRYVFTEGGVVNPMRLPSTSWDQLTSAQITAQIDRLVEVGATQIVYHHNIYSKARVIADGQADPGSATPSAYAASNSAYCTPRGINSLTVWAEDLIGGLTAAIDAYVPSGQLVIMNHSEWLLTNGIRANWA